MRSTLSGLVENFPNRTPRAPLGLRLRGLYFPSALSNFILNRRPTLALHASLIVHQTTYYIWRFGFVSISERKNVLHHIIYKPLQKCVTIESELQKKDKTETKTYDTHSESSDNIPVLKPKQKRCPAERFPSHPLCSGCTYALRDIPQMTEPVIF